MSDKPEGGKAEAEPWERMEFNKAVLAVKRISKFEPGKRDCFIFALGNKCYTKGLEEEVVMRLAQEKFGSVNSILSQGSASAFPPSGLSLITLSLTVFSLITLPLITFSLRGSGHASGTGKIRQ